MLSKCRSVMMFSSPKRLAGDHHQREHHGEAGEDGAGDEVGREDRRVPAGQLRDGEVDRHDRVHREHQRRRQAGEDQVRHLVVAASAGASRASRGRRSRRRSGASRVLARSRMVAEIGDQADVPEEQRDREVGRDGEEVPQQRAAEVRPDAHLIRERRHPVRHPRPPDVDARERCSAHMTAKIVIASADAVDRRAPLLPEQEENGRDQRAGVADADPEHEVGDVERPADRDVEAPDADALPEQPGDREDAATRAARPSS